MIRLHFVVEGQTEKAFVERLLVPHLARFDIFGRVRCVAHNLNARSADKGGIRRYRQFKTDLDLWRTEDRSPDARFTMMFDLYGLPGDFPGGPTLRPGVEPERVVQMHERAIEADVSDWRFIAYLQLHEFEALVLVDPQRLEHEFPERRDEITALALECARFESPESIDRGRDTAPSKRIVRRIPEYAGMKAYSGPASCERIGLQRLRKCCPHFASWISKLEALAKSA